MTEKDYSVLLVQLERNLAPKLRSDAMADPHHHSITMLVEVSEARFLYIKLKQENKEIFLHQIKFNEDGEESASDRDCGW